MAANWKCQDCGEIKFTADPGQCLCCGGDDWEIVPDTDEIDPDLSPPPTHR